MSSFHEVQVWCTLRRPSIPHQLQEPAVVFTDLVRFLEGAGAFHFQAAEVFLDVANVGLEVPPDDVSVVSGGLRIGWNKWTGRRETGACKTYTRKENEYGPSLQ